MRSIILSLAVSMAVAHQAVAFTYWIDGTCTGHRSMDATLAEVIAMGKGVDKRLNSASDTDFQHVWEYAMKRTKDTNDKVFKDVSGFMRDVGAMTQENDRNKANVRIYCDDEEKRWKERVDPNTGRKLGGWEDTDNWLVYRYNMRPGCLLTTLGKGKTTFGETFKEHLEGDPPVPQPDLRATISMCDLVFFINGKPKRGTTFSNYPPTADMTKPSITLDTFRHHSSKILLHELSHTNPYATTDHNGHYNWYQNDGGPTTQDLSFEQLATHADVRAILGQLAIISDRGFTLHRKPRDDANDKQKDDYEKDMKEGRLQKYDNISRRGAQGRITRHARNYASA